VGVLERRVVQWRPRAVRVRPVARQSQPVGVAVRKVRGLAPRE
jgi:hypothetical protein